MREVLSLIEAPTPFERAGRAQGRGVELYWDVEGVEVRAPGGEAATFREGAFGVQLSRSRALKTGPRRFWGRSRQEEAHRLHLELRGEGARVALLAVVEDEGVLEGLPWLDRARGHEVDEALLQRALEAALALGGARDALV